MEKIRDYKKESEIFSNALAFAAAKHAVCKNNVRKDGITPYIIHPIRVCQSLGDVDLEYKLASLFHDLLEDTDATEQEILIYSAGDEKVLEAVKLLTKPKNNFDEHQYIQQILTNPIAKAVKEADRIDNLKDSDSSSVDFQERYLNETFTYYVGKFSSKLDDQYMKCVSYHKSRKG